MRAKRDRGWIYSPMSKMIWTWSNIMFTKQRRAPPPASRSVPEASGPQRSVNLVWMIDRLEIQWCPAIKPLGYRFLTSCRVSCELSILELFYLSVDIDIAKSRVDHTKQMINYLSPERVKIFEIQLPRRYPTPSEAFLFGTWLTRSFLDRWE